MDFADIDKSRQAAGIQQKELCLRAGVNQSTYSQLKRGRRGRGGYVGTLNKLASAVEQLVKEKEASDA